VPRKKLSTTIYITPEQDEKLKLLHQRTRVPVAEYIRQGIDMVLEQYRDFFPGQLTLLPGPGLFPGPSTSAVPGPVPTPVPAPVAAAVPAPTPTTSATPEAAPTSTPTPPAGASPPEKRRRKARGQ
jgi:hypothetical protein